jgi:hypothetical protein
VPDSLQVCVPDTTIMSRRTGQSHLSNIAVQMADGYRMAFRARHSDLAALHCYIRHDYRPYVHACFRSAGRAKCDILTKFAPRLKLLSDAGQHSPSARVLGRQNGH